MKMAPRQVTVKTAARRIVAMSSTEAEVRQWNSMRPVGQFSWGWRLAAPMSSLGLKRTLQFDLFAKVVIPRKSTGKSTYA